MSMRRAIAFLGATLMLPAPPAAALLAPADAASQQAKAVAKAELKQLAADFAEAEDEFDAAVAQFESAVAGDQAARLLAVEELAQAWNVTHDALGDAIAGAIQGTSLGILGLLDDVQAQAGDPPAGPYPNGFHPGDGGALDLVEAGWRKALARTEARLAQRLAKLRGKLEKQLGLAFTVRTRPLNFQMRTSMNVLAGSESFASLRLSALEIELLVSVSPLDGSEDAVVALAGSAPSNQTVNVDLTASGLDPVNADTTSVSGRWVASASAVTEGNYAVTVSAASDTVTALASLGVR